MHNINEEYIVRSLIPPQSIASKGNATGAYVDMQGRKRLLAVVHLAAVAAEKSVKVEVLTSSDDTGTDAAVAKEVTYTAPIGGVTSHVEEIPLTVRHDYGRYVTVKITNEGSAAVLASAELVADSSHYPEERPADPAPVSGS